METVEDICIVEWPKSSFYSFSVIIGMVVYNHSPRLGFSFFHSVAFFHAVGYGFQLVETGTLFLAYDDLFFVKSCVYFKIDDETAFFLVEVFLQFDGKRVFFITFDGEITVL